MGLTNIDNKNQVSEGFEKIGDGLTYDTASCTIDNPILRNPCKDETTGNKIVPIKFNKDNFDCYS